MFIEQYCESLKQVQNGKIQTNGGGMTIEG
jgi:hypothetical protein